MKNRYKIQTIASLLLLLIVIGCDNDEFLDKQPTSGLSTGNFLRDEADAYMALAAVYGRMQANYTGTKTYKEWGEGPRMMPGWETMTDNSYATFDCGFDEFLTGSQNPETETVKLVYKYAYEGITSCNYFLDFIGQASMTEIVREQMIGEVHFIRAYWYFYLAATYGDVPILLSTEIPVEELHVAKSSQDEVFNQVIADCDAAIEKMVSGVHYNDASGPANAGHVKVDAALALKARALMYTGNDYTAAAAAAKLVIDSKVYDLCEDYRSLFLDIGDQESNPEIIYAVKMDMIPGERHERSYEEVIAYWGSVQVIPDFVEAFECTDGATIDASPLYDPEHPMENRDPRLKMIIVDSVFASNAENKTQSGYSLKKWVREEIVQDAVGMREFIREDGCDIVHIRFAEVLLLYAEAKIEANEIDQSVLDALNRIRARAYGTTLTETGNYPAVTTTNQAELREILRRERRVELCWENQRYFDLKRWGIAEEKLHGIIDPDGTVPREFLPKHYKWPLPQDALDANKNLVQNPDYN